MNEFEKKLQQQKFRTLPEEWRREILNVPPSPARPEHRSFLSTINAHMMALLWPNPKAWATMAAIWMLILVINVSTNDNATQMVNETQPRPAEYLRALQEQQQMLARLMDANLPPTEQPKTDRPRPRTEYISNTATA